MKRTVAQAISLIITCLSCSAGYYTPSPYLSAADSPSTGISFQQFYLEDFEDGALGTG